MNIKIGVSNRHVHLTREDYYILFNTYDIEKIKELVQPGEFSSDKKVSIKTDKNTIDNIRIIGPFRDYTQVEISKTDSFHLGIDPPIRSSGDLEGSEEVTIVGPYGEIKKNCCIIANRHIHINKEDRERLGLSNIDVVSVKINGVKPAIYENVFLKEKENAVLELHIDTDEANATFTKTGDEAELIL